MNLVFPNVLFYKLMTRLNVSTNKISKESNYLNLDLLFVFSHFILYQIGYSVFEGQIITVK